MAAKKKPTSKKRSDGSSLDDMKYTKEWHNKKIAEFTKRLESAKRDAPYLVKDIQKDIDWLKKSSRNSVKVAPKIPPRSAGSTGGVSGWSGGGALGATGRGAFNKFGRK
jgi:hypothetical protein